MIAPSFFDRPDTYTAIADIANHDHVTFFVGAGASAGRGLPDWGGIVGQMLEASMRRTHMNTREREKLHELVVNSLQPAGIATVATQILVEAGEGRHGVEALMSRKMTKQARKVVSLASYIVRLAIVMKAAGKNVHIVTTNYDDSMELNNTIDPVGRQLSIEHKVQVEQFARIPDERPGVVPIVHMHGMFTPEDQPDVQSVLTERDYARWNKANRRDPDASLFSYLRTRLSSGVTVFVGTSMRDGNVFDALYESDKQGAKRLAIQPLQSEMKLGIAAKASRQTVGMLAQFNDARLRNFGVETIRPDFYGQVSQFLHEVRLHVEKAAGVHHAADYMERILAWADLWNTRRDAQGAFEFDLALSRKLGEHLRGTLDRGAHGLKAAKMELWVRSAPRSRALNLAATSNTVWVGGTESSPASVPIGWLSDYAAVESFVSRKAEAGNLDRAGTHWTHYVTSPIILPDAPWHEMPVGVVALLVNSATPLKQVVSALGFNSEQGLAAHLQRSWVDEMALQ